MFRTALACVALLAVTTSCARVAERVDRFLVGSSQAVSRLPGGGDPNFATGSNDGTQINQGFGGISTPGQPTFGAGVAPAQAQPVAQQQVQQQALAQQQGLQRAAPQRMPGIQQAGLPPQTGGQPSPEPIAATQGQIADVQIKLYSLNIYPGPPNGILGLETANAVAFFQRRVGMRVDGAISEQLMFQLDRAVAEAERARRLR